MEKGTSQLAELIGPHAGRSEELIQVLREIQEKLGYLPKEAQEEVAQTLGVPLSRVYGVITFYNFFRTSPRGKHIVRLCTGTACHVGSADRILTALKSRLGVAPGETTKDLAVTLETVACLGVCALSPVMVVDDIYHGLLTPDEAVAIVDRALEEAG